MIASSLFHWTYLDSFLSCQIAVSCLFLSFWRLRARQFTGVPDGQLDATLAGMPSPPRSSRSTSDIEQSPFFPVFLRKNFKQMRRNSAARQRKTRLVEKSTWSVKLGILWKEILWDVECLVTCSWNFMDMLCFVFFLPYPDWWWKNNCQEEDLEPAKEQRKDFDVIWRDFHTSDFCEGMVGHVDWSPNHR